MRRTTLTMLAICANATATMPALAEARSPQSYDVPAGDLGQALERVARQSGRAIIAPAALTDGVSVKATKGRYTLDDIIVLLLRGSGLRAVPVGDTLVIQRSAESDAAVLKSDVVVTGTRIRGQAPVGSNVISIDRKAIAESGYATTQQIAQSIPQNFGGGPNESTGPAGTFDANAGLNATRGASINLRGLGASSTLVLLNGDRAPLSGFGGIFADISMIPVSAIERIEVVADGASAIYGSDAVAGVVNILPRLHFRGAETSVRYGSADGAAQEFQASQIIGAHWTGGELVLAYEYYRRNRLAASDRTFATDDLRRFGGADHRANYADPGTIFAGGQSFAIPDRQNGTALTASDLTVGAINRGDTWTGADILPQQQRHSGFVAASQELGTGFRVYAHGLVTLRSYDQRQRANYDTRRTVPVSNPFYVDPIGTRQPIGVNYAFSRDLGNETGRGKADGVGLTSGVEAKRGAWTIDLHGTWGRQFQRDDELNRVNSARLAVALADTNPATAYNLFGDGPSTNPATIDAVRGSSRNSFTALAWSFALRADGPLFALPGGDVRLAAGGEYRFDRFTDNGSTYDTATLTPVWSAPIAFPGPRRVRAGYAELLIPVFGGATTLPAFRRLDLSAAARTERYSDFGATTNPKLGATWEIVSGLTVRGTYGKSFRAPSFSELRQDPGTQAIFSYTIPDPSAASGQANVIVLRGNDPHLRPERATTWTLGGDVKPAVLPGFHLGITYFNIDYRDRIASPAAQIFNFLVNRSTYAPITTPNPSAAEVAALYASPIFVNFLNIPVTAPFSAIVDARLQNLSVVKERGVDLDAGYSFDLAKGRAEIGGSATRIFAIEQGLTARSPLENVVNVLGNPVDLKGRGRVSWSNAHFSVVAFANYVGSYVNRSNTIPQRVAAWTTFDLQLNYTFASGRGALGGIRVALSATNLFDRDPPYAAYYIGSYGSAYDPENANPMKRVVSLQVTKTW